LYDAATEAAAAGAPDPELLALVRGR
jgi:hypothetical protein